MAFLAIAIALFPRLRTSGTFLSIVAQVCLLAVLLFPYLVMIYDPAHSLRAASLYRQAVYINEQISLGFQWVQVDWMRGAKFDALYPTYWNYETFPLLHTPLAIFRVDHSDPIFGSLTTNINGYDISPFQFSLIDSYLYGLGYSDIFFQFARAGYFRTALAGMLLMLSTCLLEKDSIRWLGINLGCLIGLGGLLITFCFVSVLMTARILDKADTLAAQGQYGPAIYALEKAAKILPVLDSNLSFHYFRGQLYGLTHQPYEPDYHLFLGIQRVNDGLNENAMLAFRQALALDHGGHNLLSNIFAGFLLDQGIMAFNEGHFDIAVRQWQEALRVDPSHIATINHIAVAEIARGNTRSTRHYTDQVLDIQSYFQKSFRPISSHALMLQAWSYFKDNDLMQALHYTFLSKNVSQFKKSDAK
jgi:tetratricopeptide (TPR) repeat protein